MSQFRERITQIRCQQAGIPRSGLRDVPVVRVGASRLLQELSLDICDCAKFLPLTRERPGPRFTSQFSCGTITEARIQMDSTRELVLTIRADVAGIFFVGFVQEGVGAEHQHQIHTAHFDDYVMWAARTVALYEYQSPGRPVPLATLLTTNVPERLDERTRIIDLG